MSTLRLTAIGTSGSFPGPGSPASCYLLQTEDGERTHTLVLDLGSGALGPLQNHIDHTDIDAVVLSHLHPDHCLDVTGLYVMRRYDPRFFSPGAPPLPPVPVYAPRGALERLGAAHATDPGASPVPAQSAKAEFASAFDFTDLSSEASFAIGPLTITPYLVHHPVEAYAVRITHTDGTVFAYSGDSDACANLVRAAAGADAFLCEAAFEDGRDTARGIHLTGSRAGACAEEAGAGSLILTHIAPWTDPEMIRASAGRTYAGPIDTAASGSVWELSPGRCVRLTDDREPAPKPGRE